MNESRQFKLSGYMNPFIEAANRAENHNARVKNRIQKIKEKHPEYDEEELQKALNYDFYSFTEDVKLIPVPHVPTKEELVAKFGGQFKDYQVLAKIGTSGEHIHKVTANALETKDGHILWSAFSDCGSQKWNIKNPSTIFPSESSDLSKVTCNKCLGVRVKGGKEENKPSQYKCKRCGYTSNRSAFEYGNYTVKRYKCPQCQAYINTISELRIDNPALPEKKPKINPLDRPLEFSYNFKQKYKNNNNIFSDHETVKASNKEEAIAKIIKGNTSYDKETKVYDFELQRVYSYNGSKIWDKNNNTEDEIPVSSFKSKSELNKEAKFQKASFNPKYVKIKTYLAKRKQDRKSPRNEEPAIHLLPGV